MNELNGLNELKLLQNRNDRCIRKLHDSKYDLKFRFQEEKVYDFDRVK